MVMKKYGHSRAVGQGWWLESKRHSLASKGIRTGRKLASAGASLSKVHFAKAEEFVNNFSDMIDNESLKQMLKELNFDADDVKNVREEESGVLAIEVAGQDWLMFDSEDKAEEYAKDRVRQDLEDNPEYFTQSWLEGHIDTDHLRDELESDVSNMNYEYYNDIEDESDREYQNRCVAELVDGGFLDEDDVKDKDGELIDIDDKLQDKIDKAKEEASEKKTEDELKDPIQYLEDIYGKDEAMKQAIKIGGIDIDEATDDAVSTDGWQHFVASYDGDSVDLPNGKVLARTN